MAHGHSNLPGSDLLSPQYGKAPSHNKDIFAAKPGGGAGRRRAPDAPVHPSEDEYGPEPIQEEKVVKNEAKVTLTHPMWGAETGHFEEKIKVSVEGQPPADNKDITKVEFTAFRLLANGKRDVKELAKGEGHLKDGKAEAELELPAAEAEPGGKPPEKFHVVFTAKHSRSKPIDSPKMEVRKGPRSTE